MKFLNFFRNSLYSLLNKRTLGVRMLLIDNNKVLLVKHTYQSGWYTIGGGIDSGETPQEAMRRELKEEVGVTLTSPLTLFSVYYTKNENRDDYVIFFIGTKGIQEKVSSPEISEQKWFYLNQLPPDISPATLRRIEEYIGNRDISERW